MTATLAAGLPPPPLLAVLARALRATKVWLPGPAEAWDVDWRSRLPRGLEPCALPEDGMPPPGVSLAMLPEGVDAALAIAAGVALFLLPTGPMPPATPLLAPLRLAGGGLWLAGSCRAGLSAAATKSLARLAEQERAKASLDLLPPEVGALVHVLAAARVSRRALELGAGAGASSLWLASALVATGGSLIAIEKDSARVNLAQRALRAADLAARVDLRIGEVERLAPKLGRGIDLLLMDEGLEDRAERLDLLLNLGVLAQGAIIVAHGGRQDPGRDAAFQARLQLEPRIAVRLRLNLGAGVTLGVVA